MQSVASGDISDVRDAIGRISKSTTVQPSRPTKGAAYFKDIPTYVINLDRRPDRWTEASGALAKNKFTNVKRISAIDGGKIDMSQIKNMLTPEAFDSLGKVRKYDAALGSLGAIGCYLSHYKVWEEIYKSNKPGIIVEDDISFNRQWDTAPIVANSHVLLGQWDFILLAASVLFDTYREDQNGMDKLKGKFYGTHFYYLTPKGAEFFIRGAIPIDYQVDSHMSFQYELNPNVIRAGVVIDSLASQSNMSTDIQTPTSWNSFILMVNGRRYLDPITSIVHRAIFIILCILFIGVCGKLLSIILE